MSSSPLHETRTPAPSGSAALPTHLRRSLEAPIAALRASIDELEQDFAAGDERGLRLHRAGELVDDLRTCIEALVDLATDAEGESALPCGVEELGRAALRRLPAPLAERVRLALDEDACGLAADGPAAARALAFLIQTHVPGDGEALLRGSASRGELRFALVTAPQDGEHRRVDLCDARPIPAGSELLSLAAAHDVARLGGSVETRPVTGGAVHVTVRLPLTTGGR
jgi:hypothetical protein